MGDVKRKHRRYRARRPVVVSRGKERFGGEISDLSFGGFFLETDAQLPLRALVQLEVALGPDGQTLRLLGMPVREVDASDTTEAGGVGIQLFGIDAATRQRWDRFVAEIRERDGAPVASTSERDRRPALPKPVSCRQHVFRASRPELRIALDSVDELNIMRDRVSRERRLLVRTEVHLERGAMVWVHFVHPSAARTFALSGRVLNPLRTPNLTGLAIELEPLDDAMQAAVDGFAEDEIYVTIDLDLADG